MLYSLVKHFAARKNVKDSATGSVAKAAAGPVYFSDATGSELRSSRGVPA